MISFLFAFAIVAQSPSRVGLVSDLPPTVRNNLARLDAGLEQNGLPLPEKTLPQPLAAPSKITPLASPQAQASPQASFAPAPQYDQPAVVLRAVPQVYQVQRLVLAAPVASYATVDSCVQADPVAVAYADPGCGVQQQVVRQTILRQQIVHAPVVQRQAVVVQAPRKVTTKSRSRTTTKTRRGLFGRR